MTHKKPLKLTFKDLTKKSLNDWYAGTHWSKRKKTKDIYKLVVRSQFHDVLQGKFIVDWLFTFQNNPLDASNCVAMIKLVEDIIFEKDDWKHMEIGGIKSIKGDIDKVELTIYDNEKDL